jgi:hypothetical protein
MTQRHKPPRAVVKKDGKLAGSTSKEEKSPAAAD